MRFSVATLLTLSVAVLAIPQPLTPDPAGAKNVGNGQGRQFIGGACLSQADCASACCATLNGAGICSGPGAQFQAGKQGCGFGGAGAGAGSSTPAASSSSSSSSGSTSSSSSSSGSSGSSNSAINTNLPGAENVGNGQGKQFITGQCFSDADCASGCCAKLNGAGQCSGPAVAFDAGKQGCGFTN
jgi:hypothetical protein